jgi:methionyl-tRNA formyltransferase
MERILLFGDSWGIPQLLETVPSERICGIVGAEIRPQYHSELQSLADGRGIPFLTQPRKQSENYESFIRHVRALVPDLILVNSYSMLLHPEILSMPRFGCINIHTALLPKYRGSNPIQWAIINHESETGVTMHYMTNDFDAGDIIAQRSIPIFFEDTWLEPLNRAATATLEMLREEVPRLLANSSERAPQNEAAASYFHRRRPEDGAIDWSKSIVSIYDLIRALVRPLPGAFYYSGTDQVLLDLYMFIPEVTALKYSPAAGGRSLQTDGIALVPIDLDDLTLLHNSVSGSAHLRLLGVAQIENQGSVEVLETIRRRNDLVGFSVRLRGSSELIGCCWLHNINHDGFGCLQVWSNEAVRVMETFEKEVVQLLLSFAFDELNLKEIQLPDSSKAFGQDRIMTSVTENRGGRTAYAGEKANSVSSAGDSRE